MYRMQVYDERTTGMHWQTHKQGAEHYRRMQTQGRKRMDVAVAIGADPATMYSAILPLPPDLDEMMIAGFLRQSPVEMVKCQTCDLEVPAQRRVSCSKATWNWANCAPKGLSAITPASIPWPTNTPYST